MCPFSPAWSSLENTRTRSLMFLSLEISHTQSCQNWHSRSKMIVTASWRLKLLRTRATYDVVFFSDLKTQSMRMAGGPRLLWKLSKLLATVFHQIQTGQCTIPPEKGILLWFTFRVFKSVVYNLSSSKQVSKPQSHNFFHFFSSVCVCVCVCAWYYRAQRHADGLFNTAYRKALGQMSARKYLHNLVAKRVG